MKRLGILILLTMMLGACSGEPEEKSEELDVDTSTEEVVENEPSQEELNAVMKDEAEELDFIKANGDEVPDGAKVKATGEITLISHEGLRGGDFTLTTEEGDGFGMYNVINLNTTGFDIEEGQNVTIYGSFDGRDDSGMPQIVCTIIESN